MLTFSKRALFDAKPGYLIHLYIFISPSISKLFAKFEEEHLWHITILSRSPVTVLKLYFHHRCLPRMLKLRTLNSHSQTDAQPEFFHDRGSFVELRDFDNRLLKNIEKAPHFKMLVFFSLILLKLDFEWKTFLEFQKGAGESSSSP